MGNLSVNAIEIELVDFSARGKRKSDSDVARHAEMESVQQRQKPKEADSRGCLSFFPERSQVKDAAAPMTAFAGLGFILSTALSGPAGLTAAFLILSLVAVAAVLATAFDAKSLCESDFGMRSF